MKTRRELSDKHDGAIHEEDLHLRAESHMCYTAMSSSKAQVGASSDQSIELSIHELHTSCAEAPLCMQRVCGMVVKLVGASHHHFSMNIVCMLAW